MTEKADKKTIDRVCRMELYFNILTLTLKEAPDMLKRDKYIMKILKALTDYYDKGEWRRDYELDERGGFPKELKRGVLSEDGIYNLLTEIKSAITPHL